MTGGSLHLERLPHPQLWDGNLAGGGGSVAIFPVNTVIDTYNMNKEVLTAGDISKADKVQQFTVLFHHQLGVQSEQCYQLVGKHTATTRRKYYHLPCVVWPRIESTETLGNLLEHLQHGSCYTQKTCMVTETETHLRTSAWNTGML